MVKHGQNKVGNMSIKILLKYFWFLENSGLYISWELKIMLLEHFFGNVWASVQAPAGLARVKQRSRGDLSLALSRLVFLVSRCASAIMRYPAVCKLSSVLIRGE